jgi:protein-L-isoaspartate(D-aspartate) O-methyltransferase
MKLAGVRGSDRLLCDRFLGALVVAAIVGLAACGGGRANGGGQAGSERAASDEPSASDKGSASGEPEASARDRMVRETIEARDVRDSLVLAAMRAVPRHLFVPEAERDLSYGDHPLPIGAGQTISQPYIVAAMTELLDLRPGEKVLEIGTGSGYQAAVLAEITDKVYSIEIVESLAKSAAARLKELGYGQVQVRAGDGYRGWPEVAPFDAIIVTAAPDHVPQPLVDQLAQGGRLVIPVGDTFQELKVFHRDADGKVVERSVFPVRFVPMTGEAEERRVPAPAPSEGAR